MSTHDVITNLVRYKSVNKSTIFLYSLLQLKTVSVQPLGTYMGINNCSIFKDMNLICMFHKNQEGFEQIDKELKAHKQFDFHVEEDDYVYYIMDFSSMPKIYNAVRNGHYSKLPKEAKFIIGLRKHPIGLIGTYPELYYDEYAEEFKVDVELLKRDGELLEPPDMKNEILVVSEKLVAELSD